MATILTIIPYKFYPPTGGGALRCFYILREMARIHVIYLLTCQSEEEFRIGGEPILSENIKIISFNASTKYSSLLNIFPNRIADALNYRFINRSLKGPTDSSLLEIYPGLFRLLNTYSFDLIFYESLEAIGLLGKIISAKSLHSKKLYDAHNVDSELWSQKAVAEQKIIYTTYANKALQIESNLFKKVNSFFSCSEDDYNKLCHISNKKIKGFIVPNGVDIEERPFDNNENKYLINNILFCGSLDYFPNKEGLIWFYEKVFPYLKIKRPGLTLTIVGSLKSKDEYKFLQKDPNVNFVGKVESVVPYYQQSSIAIVPLLSGSGTRLKILEAMSMGNPVVSTSVGAKGINYNAGINLSIADHPKKFGDEILTLLDNKIRFDDIRNIARALVEAEYEWKYIGTLINKNIAVLLNK